MDQRGGEEVWRRAMESHLPEIPLPEPHSSDDQGSLADHEKAGNALKLGATGGSMPKFLILPLMAVRRLLCSSSTCTGASMVSTSGTQDCYSR